MSTSVVAVDQLLEQHRVEQFLFREARLIDERRFGELEELWDDGGVYWVPANGDNTDPERDVSIIYDSRSRLHTRIERYASGLAFSQQPPPRTTHIVANVEIDREAERPDGVLVVYSTLQVAESRPGVRIDWAGRTTHHLVAHDKEFRIAYKKVVLVNNDQELTTLDFLL